MGKVRWLVGSMIAPMVGRSCDVTELLGDGMKRMNVAVVVVAVEVFLGLLACGRDLRRHNSAFLLQVAL